MYSRSVIKLMFIILLAAICLVLFFAVYIYFWPSFTQRSPIYLEASVRRGYGVEVKVFNDWPREIRVVKVVIINSLGLTRDISHWMNLPKTIPVGDSLTLFCSEENLRSAGMQLRSGEQYIIQVYVEGWEEPFEAICIGK